MDIKPCFVLKAGSTEYERADRLMNLLVRGNDTYLPQFYDALMSTNQQHVVHLMNFKGTHVSSFYTWNTWFSC